MDSRPTFRPIWRALLKRTVAEIKWFVAIGALLVLVLFVPTFNPELNATGETPDTPLPGRLTLSERLGYATLLNSGLGVLQSLSAADRQALRLQAQLPWPVQLSSYSSIPVCLSDETIKIEDQELSLQTLTVAILAAEIYNRDKIIRKIKEIVSNGYQHIFNEIPDFSYGIGQVKLSTAKEILRQTVGDGISDEDVVELLQSDCDNAAIAEAYIKQLLDSEERGDNRDSAIAAVAASYQGASHDAQGSRLYVMAVLGAYHLLLPDQAPDAGGASTNVNFCVGFARGATVASDQSDFTSFLDEHPAARLVSASADVWTDEQKPDAYRQALQGAREKWVKENLESLGFNAAHTEIKAITAAGRKARLAAADCGAMSFVKITLDMPWPVEEETAPEKQGPSLPPPLAAMKSPNSQSKAAGAANDDDDAASTAPTTSPSTEKSQKNPSIKPAARPIAKQNK